MLERAAELCPPGWTLTVYEGLAQLPAFDPDLDGAEGLPAVQDWRRALAGCGALLICTPEYAHGMPGSLKNALDWVVGSGELVDKPVGLVHLCASTSEHTIARRVVLPGSREDVRKRTVVLALHMVRSLLSR